MDGRAPTTRRPEDGVGHLEGPADASRGGGVGSALLGVAWTVIFPWLGPAGYWYTLGRFWSDFWELTGFLVWPGVFCLIGVYLATLDRERVRRVAGEDDRVERALRVHGRLSTMSLFVLAAFEGAMVLVMSTWRWNRDERYIEADIFKFCLAAYVLHVAVSLLARRALRRARPGDDGVTGESGA
ncbi:MAG: hypothetical protein ACYTKD_22260 [Planctomycetota bacterium]|jgi:hypothetical protein